MTLLIATAIVKVNFSVNLLYFIKFKYAANVYQIIHFVWLSNFLDTPAKSNQKGSPSCVPILVKSDRRNNSNDVSLAVEALAIGNRSRIKYGLGNYKLSVKPPGPCPRCKDYRHWHYEKDCRVAKCKRCHKIGHKSTRCPAQRRQNTFDIDNHSAKVFPSVDL